MHNETEVAESPAPARATGADVAVLHEVVDAPFLHEMLHVALRVKPPLSVEAVGAIPRYAAIARQTNTIESLLGAVVTDPDLAGFVQVVERAERCVSERLAKAMVALRAYGTYSRVPEDAAGGAVKVMRRLFQ